MQMDSMRLQRQNYRFHRKITETSYSDLYEYEILTPGNFVLTRVAVKQISFLRSQTSDPGREQPRTVTDDPNRDQFAAARLLALGDDQHLHIVRVHDCFVEQDSLVIVMDFYPEGDLLQFLHLMDGGILDQATAIQFMQQIVRGVQFLHERCGIAHRDLSLENVLLDNGVCRIADFGLSTHANELCTDFVGKEYYMAPEVMKQETYDPVKADVWSLGMILFIMLVGSPLCSIPCQKTDEKFKALAMGGVEGILVASGWGDSFQPEVVVLLSKMLQIDPTKRIAIDAILELPIMR